MRQESELSKTQAKIVEAEYERLRGIHGTITDDIFIDAARDPKSPLHGLYDWNKDRVFTLYLRERTQYLLRSVGLTVSSNSGEALTIRSIIRKSDGEYVPLREIKPESEDAAWVRAQCVSDLKSAQRRLAALSQIFGDDRPKVVKATRAVSRAQSAVEQIAV